jgi:argininosuccinate synthase
MKRTVLAYSGSPAGSASIAWLAQQHACEVVTMTLDFGQDRQLAAVREQALALGAVRAHVIDVREEFVRAFLLPALQTGALADGYALTRPLIARRLVEMARMESAFAVAHAALPGSEVAAALEREITALGVEVLAPVQESGSGVEALISTARARGVHVGSAGRYRVDASAWGRRIVPLGDDAVPEDAFALTRSPEECPGDPALIGIEFQAGVPVRANGVELSMTELIESLETIAGAHGVGRSRDGRVFIEAPASTVLAMAHSELERHVVGADLARLLAQLAQVYADALSSGRWFSDIREAIDAFVRVVQPRVTGTVTLRLLKGECAVVDCAPAAPPGLRASAAAARKVVA